MTLPALILPVWTLLVWANWLHWNWLSGAELANALAPWGAISVSGALDALVGDGALFAWAGIFWLAARGAGVPAARLLGAPPGRVVQLAIGACLIGFAGLGAGLAGLAFGPVARVVLVAGAAAGVRGLSRPRLPRLPGVGVILTALLLVAGLLLPLIGALAPEASFDGMAHHLAHPELYAAAHRVYAIPSHFLATYPSQLEMQYLVARLVSGTPQLSRLLHWSWGLLTLGALFRWARDWLETEWALAATAAFLFTPYVQLVMMWAYVDLGAACLVTLAMRQAAARTPGGALVGVLAGLAAGIKVTGVFALILVALILALRRARLPVWARMAAGVAVTLGPWAARNALSAGNPAAPFLASIWPVVGWGTENHARYQRELASYDAGPATLHGPLALLARPWDATIRNTGVLDTRAGMGAWVLWGLPLASAAGIGGLPLVTALGWYALWQCIPHQVRYLMPAWPAAVIAGALALRALTGTTRWGRGVLLGTAALLVWHLPNALRLQREAGDPVRVVLGAERPEQYLARGMPGHEPALRTRAWLALRPGDERTLVANQYGLGLFWGPRAITQSFFDTPLIEGIATASHNAEEIARRFRQQRIGRVVCDTENNMLMQATYGIYRMSPMAGARWRDYWSRAARLEYSADGRLLVYRLGRPGAPAPVSEVPGLDEQAVARLDDAQTAAEQHGQRAAEVAAAEAAYLEAATRTNLPAAWERLGLVRLRAGRRGASREALRRAAALGRNTAALHNGLGVADAQDGRLESAMAAFRSALALDPGYTTARRNLAMCLKGKGREAEGLVLLQEGLARDPGSAELREAWAALTGRHP